MSEDIHSVPMERVMGIEPTRPAWKAGILPLNYTRRFGTCIVYHNLERLSSPFFEFFYFIYGEYEKVKAANGFGADMGFLKDFMPCFLKDLQKVQSVVSRNIRVGSKIIYNKCV